MNESESEIDKAEKLLDASAPEGGVEVYMLVKPVTVNGTNYTELKLDFNSLTSKDMEAVETAIVMEGGLVPQVREFSKTYQLHLVARAAKINIHDIRAFSMKDATALTLRAQGFLMSAG